MYAGVERRRYPRLNHGFLVHYPMQEYSDAMDLSQIKNISLGGVLFTTLKPYDTGTDVPLKIKLPGGFVEPRGRVIESKTVCAGTIFDTRFEFSSIADADRKKISQVIEHYLNQEAA